MKCWRFDLRRYISRYLNGELQTREIKTIENHLLDCAACRARVARLREGHRLATDLPRETPERDSWPAIAAVLDSAGAGFHPDPRAADLSRRRRRPGLPGFATAVAIIAILLVAAALVYYRSSAVKPDAAQLPADGFEDLDFHRVSIAGIERNTEPHVVAEGYVSEVRVDHDDGDLVFKLVDDIGKPGPFIVCEILNPRRLTPPSVGSRVRVYGVSRYDNQENHNWYEVHPVLNIELVGR